VLARGSDCTKMTRRLQPLVLFQYRPLELRLSVLEFLAFPHPDSPWRLSDLPQDLIRVL
jgi:hypothetical protein